MSAEIDEAIAKLKRAAKAESALEWFEEFGIAEAEFSKTFVEFRPLNGAALPGAGEARDYLKEAILQKMGEIIVLARAKAQSDLEAGQLFATRVVL